MKWSRTVEELNQLSLGALPGLLGIEILDIIEDKLISQMQIRPDLLAGNGYLHAATVVALADTTCGYGTVASLPAGAVGFTTIELKSNFLSTALEGVILCEGAPVHQGQTTQVWDARVTDQATGRTLAV